MSSKRTIREVEVGSGIPRAAMTDQCVVPLRTTCLPCSCGRLTIGRRAVIAPHAYSPVSPSICRSPWAHLGHTTQEHTSQVLRMLHQFTQYCTACNNLDFISTKHDKHAAGGTAGRKRGAHEYRWRMLTPTSAIVHLTACQPPAWILIIGQRWYWGTYQSLRPWIALLWHSRKVVVM
jgi:hypothetical protein